MASVTIKVDGLRQLGERMRTLKADVANRIARSATGKAASLIKKEAKSNIRRSPSVDTGSLLDAVIVKKVPKGQTTLTSEHIVSVRRRRSGRKTKTKQRTAPHAAKVEFGTVNMPAEPFLRPAFDHNKRKAVDIMKDALDKGLRKVGR